MTRSLSFAILATETDVAKELRGALSKSGRARVLVSGDSAKQIQADIIRLRPDAACYVHWQLIFDAVVLRLIVYLFGELQPGAPQEEIVMVLVRLDGYGFSISLDAFRPGFLPIEGEAVLVDSVGAHGG